MLEKYSYAITIILLISSIISPIVTTVINNKHQLALKKLDMYEIEKRKALADFIECAEDFLLNPHYVEQSVKYYSSLDKLFIYFSDISLNTFTSLEKASKNLDDLSIAKLELSKIAQKLSKQIKKE